MFEKLGDWEDRFGASIQRGGRSNSTSRAILLPVVPDRVEWDAFLTAVRREWEDWRSQLSGYPASLLMLYCGLAFYEYDENRLWPQFARVVGSEELPANQQSEINSREQLIDDIIDKSYGDANALRQLRFRLGTHSLAQLREKRRTIDFKAQVHTKTEAKTFIAQNRSKELGWRGTGYPRLLSSIVPAGQVQAVPTGQYLRDLAKSHIWLFKRMVKLYSSDQIDYWMNQQ